MSSYEKLRPEQAAEFDAVADALADDSRPRRVVQLRKTMRFRALGHSKFS